MAPYGRVWPRMALHGPVWPRMAPYDPMGPFGPILPHMTPYDPILARMAPYSPIWPCSKLNYQNIPIKNTPVKIPLKQSTFRFFITSCGSLKTFLFVRN